MSSSFTSASHRTLAVFYWTCADGQNRHLQRFCFLERELLLPFCSLGLFASSALPLQCRGRNPLPCFAIPKTTRSLGPLDPGLSGILCEAVRRDGGGVYT